MSNELIPGANAVGFGFNITGKYDIASVTTRVFAEGDISPTPFSVPGGQQYDCPENLDPISDSTTDAAAYVTQTQADFQKIFADSLGVDASAGAFSGEFNYAYSNTFDSSVSYYYCWLRAYWRAYTLTLKDQSQTQLSDAFTSDLGDLPADFNDDSSAAYFDFIDKYGTHFVSGVACGASMRYYLAVMNSYSSDQTTIHADVELEYKAVFVDTTANASADWSTLTQNWASSRTVQIYAVGGDNSLVSLIDPGYGTNIGPDNSGDPGDFQKWVTSMPQSPAILEFTLQRLSMACGDKSDAMDDAINSYTNGVLLLSADIEYAPITHNISAAVQISLEGNTIVPSPDVPMPPPYYSTWNLQYPPSGFQIAVFASDTFATLLSKVYYFAEPLPPHSVDIYALMAADIKTLPDTDYFIAAVGFGIDRIGNFPSVDVVNWFTNCGAKLEGWRADIGSSAGSGVLNYLLVGTRGMSPGEATERYETIDLFGETEGEIISLYTTLTFLLYGQ